MDKTYVFEQPGNGYGNGYGNGIFGGEGIWAILLLALFGRNGFGGFGGNGYGGQIPEILSGDAGRELLMSAIQGNGNAISQLATTLNCDINAMQTALHGIDKSICQVGNQVGMSSMQIINAIQSGDNALAAQICDCCCKTNNNITTQGFEGRLATERAANSITNNADCNTRSILAEMTNDRFARQADKIEALREKNQTLQFEISQRNQNEYIASMIAPINAELARLRCKETPTYAQPYIPGIPTATFSAPLCGGFGAFGAGYAAGEATV